MPVDTDPSNMKTSPAYCVDGESGREGNVPAFHTRNFRDRAQPFPIEINEGTYTCARAIT